jgi:hypothetical protein
MFYHVCKKLTTYFLPFGLTGWLAEAAESTPSAFTQNKKVHASPCSCGFHACRYIARRSANRNETAELSLGEVDKKLPAKVSRSVLGRLHDRSRRREPSLEHAVPGLF